MKLRPSVQKFAEQMEAKLREHDTDKGRTGWRDEDVDYLAQRLVEEARELAEAIGGRCKACSHPIFTYSTAEEAIQEAVDVANMAMMVAEILERRGLDWAEKVDDLPEAT